MQRWYLRTPLALAHAHVYRDANLYAGGLLRLGHYERPVLAQRHLVRDADSNAAPGYTDLHANELTDNDHHADGNTHTHR